MRLLTRHVNRLRRTAPLLCGVVLLGVLGTTGTASAEQYVVFVEDGAAPATVASSVNARADLEFTEVANGFAADLTAAQVKRLEADARVVDVREDAPFALMPFKRTPFKRTPFKRTPFDGAPFKRTPFKRTDQGSPYFRQVEPTGVQRIGAAGWANNVDADIAILDGGVDARHPDLNVVAAVSCVRGQGTEDRDGHGTMVAGLAAARDNGFGVVGAAPGARIWSVKVADANGTIMESSALCGLEYVLRNSRSLEVANMSWSGESPLVAETCSTVLPPSPNRTRDWRKLPIKSRGYWPWRKYHANPFKRTAFFGRLDPFKRTAFGVDPFKRTPNTDPFKRTDSTSADVDPAAVDLLHAVACRANDAGVTLVAAAGNDAEDAGGYLPAAWDAVIAVSSLSDTDGKAGGRGGPGCLTGDPDDTLSSFSNFGSVIDVAAPGECLVTTDTGGDYAIGSGTSFAAPLVSGVAAVHASRDPRATPISIRAKILSTVERGPINGDSDGNWEGVLRASR